MFVYAYKKGSKSAKALAKALRCKVLLNPRRSRRGMFVNWGSVMTPNVKAAALNHAVAVGYASHKLATLQILKESNIACPEFTTDKSVAKGWLEEGEIVFCRKLLKSHSGKGIVIAKNVNELVDAPLYVKYFNKTYEFRVHVFNGKVIDSVQKRKRTDVDGMIYNKYVRSHKNGWVFCRDNNNITENAKTLAIESVQALGLNFGAVDIVMTTDGKCKVLEVNTAPALEGSTLTSYVNAIKEYVNV